MTVPSIPAVGAPSDLAEGTLMIVAPAVFRKAGAQLQIARSCAPAVRSYLGQFRSVEFMCVDDRSSGAAREAIYEAYGGSERLKVSWLLGSSGWLRHPLRHGSIASTLRKGLKRADYVLLVPRCASDWAVRTADLCVRMGVPFSVQVPGAANPANLDSRGVGESTTPERQQASLLRSVNDVLERGAAVNAYSGADYSDYRSVVELPDPVDSLPIRSGQPKHVILTRSNNVRGAMW